MNERILMRPSILQNRSLLLLAVLVMSAAPLRAADVIEKLRGSRLKGTIVAETDSHFTMQVRLRGSGGSGSLRMNVSKNSVHAVTMKGQRRVINPRRPAQGC